MVIWFVPCGWRTGRLYMSARETVVLWCSGACWFDVAYCGAEYPFFPRDVKRIGTPFMYVIYLFLLAQINKDVYHLSDSFSLGRQHCHMLPTVWVCHSAIYWNSITSWDTNTCFYKWLLTQVSRINEKQINKASIHISSDHLHSAVSAMPHV